MKRIKSSRIGSDDKTFRCDPDLGSDRLYYLALRAVDRYYDQWGADPGEF